MKSEEKRQLLAKQCHDQHWMAEAPVHIVCVADIRSRIKEGDFELYEDSPEFELKQIIRDTAIAVEHMVLKAEDLGLGTCWIAWFEQDDIRPVINIPKDKFVLAVLTIGYKDEEPSARPRKVMEDIIMYETWQ